MEVIDDKPKIICGIDPGLHSTGVVIGPSPTNWLHSRIRKNPALDPIVIGESVKARQQRMGDSIARIVKFIRAAAPKGIYAIVIEDFIRQVPVWERRDKRTGQKVKKPGMIDTRHLEFASLLRHHTYRLADHYVEVSATTLKKFATGSGRAKKDDVMLSIYQRWGATFANSDEADAFALWRLGLGCFGGVEPDESEPAKFVDAYRSSVRVVMDRYKKGVDDG